MWHLWHSLLARHSMTLFSGLSAQGGDLTDRGSSLPSRASTADSFQEPLSVLRGGAVGRWFPALWSGSLFAAVSWRAAPAVLLFVWQ